jgi:hypothetical protein
MFNLLLLPCKCSTCLKSPNCKIVQNIQTDSMVFRDNRPFNPTDPLRTADKMRLTVELRLLVMVLPIGDPPTGLQGFTFTLCNCISNIPVFDLTCDLQQTFPPPPPLYNRFECALVVDDAICEENTGSPFLPRLNVIFLFLKIQHLQRVLLGNDCYEIGCLC